jgi:signal transduction histidine kinase/ActR/RegA family two-component response regulator
MTRGQPTLSWIARLGGPSLDAEDLAGLRAEQTEALFRSVAPAVLAAAAGAAFLSGLLVHLHTLSVERGVGWSLFIAGGAIAHISLAVLYFRTPRAHRGRRRWLYLFTAICVAEGMGWGWAPVFLVPDSQFDSKILIMAITIAISAGSIPPFSPYLPAAGSFFLAATVPYTVSSVTAANPMQQATALMMVLYILAVGGLGVIASRNFKELVSLRLQTSALAKGLSVQKDIAERANIAKSNFLAAASHDLRQPVHALGLFVGALRNVAMPREGRRLVEQIETSTAAMDSLFSALLDISRLDAGIVEVHPRAFQIQPLLDRICRDYEDEANAKGIALSVARCSAIVDADPILIERIVRNLVSNAVRYTQKGRVFVGCRRGAVLRVEVWDTGSGISSDQQESIFQEYFQLDNSERDRAKGLGLGLAIVKRLTDLIGSDLRLWSQPGRGSCFSITAPLAHVDALRSDLGGDGPKASPARGLIVVVDDEIAIREAMAALLSSWGHEVITAGCGDEVLTQMANCPKRPNLLICDYRLRVGETGIEVIEALRSEYNEAIPAMLITGDTAPDRLVEARASGLLLLHKPVPNGKLRAAVANLMQGPQRGFLAERG